MLPKLYLPLGYYFINNVLCPFTSIYYFVTQLTAFKIKYAEASGHFAIVFKMIEHEISIKGASRYLDEKLIMVSPTLTPSLECWLMSLCTI